MMSQPVSRRNALAQMAAVAAAVIVWPRFAAAQAKTPIVVYKDPNCGCCHKWVEHLTANGFEPSVTDTSRMAEIKARYKVGNDLQSCHTSVVGGYVIEGHVPAADIRKLLAGKPKGILGLTIPGMPASAPGMDMSPFQPYTVLSFDGAGKTAVFVEHARS